MLKPTFLLWTGGYDSTFRLVQLVLEEKKYVQPYYLIGQRKSTLHEIRAMQLIKSSLFEKYPHTRDLILPTQFFDLVDVKENQEITSAFESIVLHKFIGKQYEFLARLCHQLDISEIELSIHQDDRVHSIVSMFFSNSEDKQIEFGKALKKDIFTVFRYFKFPVFNLTKLQMASYAKQKDFTEIMSMTWFCHQPVFGKIPCGNCAPCRYTIEEGLGYRIPWYRKVRFLLRKMVRQSP